MKEFTLKPVHGQKSFYGKATVFEIESGYKILKSYDTFVCMLDPKDKFIRLWNGYSVTTAKHVNSFLNLYGLQGMNKKEWSACPCPDYIRSQEIASETMFYSVGLASKLVFEKKVKALTSAVNIPALQNSIKEYLTEDLKK